MRWPGSILLAAAGLLAGASGAGAAPARVALLPVTVHSNDPASAYLSAGLASMLSSRLEQFEEIAVIRLDAAKPGADSAEAALAASRDAGADFVVYGSFTQFGEGASLDLHCARVAAGDGDARRIFVQSGTLGEIIPKLDALAEKIRLHVSGGHPPAAAEAAETSGAGGGLGDLERRVEALERSVFRSGPEQGPSAPPPPKAAASGGAPVR